MEALEHLHERKIVHRTSDWNPRSEVWMGMSNDEVVGGSLLGLG